MSESHKSKEKLVYTKELKLQMIQQVNSSRAVVLVLYFLYYQSQNIIDSLLYVFCVGLI